jgi:hypothetical protein
MIIRATLGHCAAASQQYAHTAQSDPPPLRGTAELLGCAWGRAPKHPGDHKVPCPCDVTLLPPRESPKPTSYVVPAVITTGISRQGQCQVYSSLHCESVTSFLLSEKLPAILFPSHQTLNHRPGHQAGLNVQTWLTNLNLAGHLGH